MDGGVGLPKGFDSGPASGGAMILGPIIRGVVDTSGFSIAADVAEEDEDTVAEGELTCECVGKTISDSSLIILSTSNTGGSLLSGTESSAVSTVRTLDCITLVISFARA